MAGTTVAVFHSYKDTNDSVPRQTLPCILACGYRQVFIPKTGRTFPAWRIAFCTTRSSAARTAAWRSKHDIYLLQRATRAANIEFPKAAFAKLVDAAPWTSPALEEDEHFVCGDPASTNNNWHRRMLKNFLQANQFLQACSASRSDSVMEAWKVFARRDDTENLVSSTALDHQQPETCRLQASHELGQYFCSPENATLLVDTCLDRLVHIIGMQSDIVFIEPSVGRGDIVEALRQGLRDQQSLALYTKRIVGFDLDSSSIDSCRKRFTESDTKFVACDFMKTRRQNHVPEKACTVFLGGPPYSANHSSKDDAPLDRAIPMRFVEHAMREWNARLVAFLMPKRCQRYSYSSLLPTDCQWKTLELPSSIFYFQGAAPVQQPSVLQIFWRQ